MTRRWRSTLQPKRLKVEASAATIAVMQPLLRLLRPPPPISVSEWAKKHRVLSRKDGSVRCRATSPG